MAPEISSYIADMSTSQSTNSGRVAPRRILLIDADAFFVAVARKVDPEGAGRAPLLIVGGRPGSRGVVCSASYECRALGVRSAMPISRALRLCPEALCVPVPRKACLRNSRDIAAVLSQFAPVVQPSSIDEWYCDLAGTEALYAHEPLETTAERIRREVLDVCGLGVSIGGGSSRLVAKMAVELAKPKPCVDSSGVHCVAPGAEAEFLGQFRLADLPMVGPRLAARLEPLGLTTVEQAQQLTEDALVHALGNRTGRWLFRRVRGLDDSVVVASERKKQVSREITFEHDLDVDDVVDRELLRLAVRVSSDLRRHALGTRTVTVRLRDYDFRTRSAQRTLRVHIESERAVASVARSLLAQMRAGRSVPVRLLGIALSNFDDGTDGPTAATQFGLFPSPEPEKTIPGSVEANETTKDRALVHAIDRIRLEYGANAILPARLVDQRGNTGRWVEE